MSKLQISLALICFAHICLSASIDKPVPPQSNALEENNDDKDKSSGEMTMAEVDEIKQELLKTMPEKDAEGIASIFRKFTKDATDEDKFEGFMELMMLGLAANQNKTGSNLMRFLADSSEENGLTKKD